MSAYVNGALSALEKCLNLINFLDPKGEDVNLKDMKNQINIYMAVYKEIDEMRQENPVNDETWENIKKACSSEYNLDDLKKILFKAQNFKYNYCILNYYFERN